MKKCFSALLIICILMSVFCTGALADGYDFELSMLNATSTSVSVNVKNASASPANAMLYIAAYDEDDALLGVACESISPEAGQTITVTATLSVNKAYKLKAFVWGGICTPKSNVIYKTTASEGDIEYGGEI